MKKAIAVLLTLCVLFGAVGCSIPEGMKSVIKPTEKDFTIDSYDLRITADSSFREDTGGSFDLQITNDDAYVSVMAYKYMDLPEGTTPQDVYEIQNEDIFSKRTAVKVVEDTKEEKVDQRTVTYAVHSAERDGTKNYYATYLVDCPEQEICAWVLVTAMPSYMDKNRDYLHDIVCSLTPVE